METWSADALLRFEERAAALEFDCGQSRSSANQTAYSEVFRESYGAGHVSRR